MITKMEAPMTKPVELLMEPIPLSRNPGVLVKVRQGTIVFADGIVKVADWSIEPKDSIPQHPIRDVISSSEPVDCRDYVCLSEGRLCFAGNEGTEKNGT